VLGLHPQMTSKSILQTVGTGPDIYSYLKASQELMSGSQVANYAWVLNLWPPGMVGMHSFLTLIFSQTHLPLIEGIFISFLISTIPSICWNKSSIHILLKFVAMFILWWAIFFGLNFSVYTSMMSDIYFVTVMCFIFVCLAGPITVKKSMLIGFLLAIASYFRQVGESTFYLLNIFIVFYFAQELVRSNVFSKSIKKVRYLIIVSCAYLLVTLPWRIVRIFWLKSFSWSSSDRLLWAHTWMNQDYLRERSANWVYADGGNWACSLNRLACSKIGLLESKQQIPFDTSNISTLNHLRSAALSQIFHNPFAFISNRSGFFYHTLTTTNMSRFFDYTKLVYCLGVLSVFLLIYTVVWLLVSLNQFEARYCWPLIVIGVVSLLLFHPQNRRSYENE